MVKRQSGNAIMRDEMNQLIQAFHGSENEIRKFSKHTANVIKEHMNRVGQLSDHETASDVATAQQDPMHGAP